MKYFCKVKEDKVFGRKKIYWVKRDSFHCAHPSESDTEIAEKSFLWIDTRCQSEYLIGRTDAGFLALYSGCINPDYTYF